MQPCRYPAASLLSIVALTAILQGCAATHTRLPTDLPSEKVEMTHHASGSFEVKLAPQPPDDPSGAAGPGRMTIDKQFHGDLEAVSVGQMLAYGTAVQGSAGYVAMERVTGTLAGRHGSFALQHSGTMDRSTPALSVTVVPDSGTDELVGLSGCMNIVVESGMHSYTFDYGLPATP